MSNVIECNTSIDAVCVYMHGHTDVVHLLPVASYYGGNTDIHSTVAIAVVHVMCNLIV